MFLFKTHDHPSSGLYILLVRDTKEWGLRSTFRLRGDQVPPRGIHSRNVRLKIAESTGFDHARSPHGRLDSRNVVPDTLPDAIGAPERDPSRIP